MKSAKLHEHYDRIIRDLRSGQQAMLALDKEIIQELCDELSDRSNIADPMPLLCLLDHCPRPVVEVGTGLLQLGLQLNKPDHLVAWLGVSQKHFIERQSRDGDPVPSEYIDLLKQILSDYRNQSWEVLEWVLRTVEMLGPMGVQLRGEIEVVRPKILSMFNTHQRQFFELYEMLLKNWSKMRE